MCLLLPWRPPRIQKSKKEKPRLTNLRAETHLLNLSFLRPQFDNPSYSLFILNSWHVSPKIIIQNEWKQSHSGEAWRDTEGHAAQEKRRAGVREERPSAAAHRLREG